MPDGWESLKTDPLLSANTPFSSAKTTLQHHENTPPPSGKSLTTHPFKKGGQYSITYLYEWNYP
jgi:hypothetical protein